MIGDPPRRGRGGHWGGRCPPQPGRRPEFRLAAHGVAAARTPGQVDLADDDRPIERTDACYLAAVRTLSSEPRSAETCETECRPALSSVASRAPECPRVTTRRHTSG